MGTCCNKKAVEEDLPDNDHLEGNEQKQAVNKKASLEDYRILPEEKNEPEEKKEEEQLPDLEKDFNEKDVKNITKIQASIRGSKARKEARDAQKKQEETKKQENKPQEEPEALPDLEKDFNAKDVKNITKIQASIRGSKARKEVREANKKTEPKP